MKLIYLKWKDACSNSGWFTKEEALKWAKDSIWVVEQVGWLLEENKEYIILIGRQDGDRDEKTRSLGMLQKIPKTWIVKRIDLTKHIK